MKPVSIWIMAAVCAVAFFSRVFFSSYLFSNFAGYEFVTLASFFWLYKKSTKDSTIHILKSSVICALILKGSGFLPLIWSSAGIPLMYPLVGALALVSFGLWKKQLEFYSKLRAILIGVPSAFFLSVLNYSSMMQTRDGALKYMATGHLDDSLATTLASRFILGLELSVCVLAICTIVKFRTPWGRGEKAPITTQESTQKAA